MPRRPILLALAVAVVTTVGVLALVRTTQTNGAPAGSGGRPASAPTGDVQVQAQGIKFLEASWTAPADKPFTIAFSNEDPGTPHNIELKNAADQVVFRGDVFNGVATRIYNVPAQPAGEYKFLCTVHPTMTGTATLQ